jgi:flagellar protein FliJ
MLKFKFKLETVLKHRAVLEEQAMQAFAEAQSRLAACIARAAALELQFQQVVLSRPSSFDACEIEQLALRERHLDSLRRQIEEQERMREGLEARLEDSRVLLVRTRQNRQTVDRLREIDLAEYRKSVDKAEQDAMDELATIRFERAG